MPEPYEDAAREYLEFQGYFIRQDVKFWKWGNEVDIVTVLPRGVEFKETTAIDSKGTILKKNKVPVAEVTAAVGNEATIRKLKKQSKNPELKETVKKLTGRPPDKYETFFWVNAGTGDKVRVAARRLLQDQEGMTYESLQNVAKYLANEFPGDRIKYQKEKPLATVMQLLPEVKG